MFRLCVRRARLSKVYGCKHDCKINHFTHNNNALGLIPLYGTLVKCLFIIAWVGPRYCEQNWFDRNRAETNWLDDVCTSKVWPCYTLHLGYTSLGDNSVISKQKCGGAGVGSYVKIDGEFLIQCMPSLQTAGFGTRGIWLLFLVDWVHT